MLSISEGLRRVNDLRNSVRSAGLYGLDGRRKYLNRAERRRFMAAADAAAPEVRTLCLTLTLIGCRLSEALVLTAGDVDQDSGLVAVRTLKQRGRMKVRQVPAPPALLALLARVHGLDQAPAGRRLWRWHRTRAWELVKLTMAAGQVTGLSATPKGLRHGFAVNAVQARVPLTLLQKWMGHSDLAVTRIYLDVIGPEEQEIAARMWS